MLELSTKQTSDHALMTGIRPAPRWFVAPGWFGLTSFNRQHLSKSHAKPAKPPG